MLSICFAVANSPPQPVHFVIGSEVLSSFMTRFPPTTSKCSAFVGQTNAQAPHPMQFLRLRPERRGDHPLAAPVDIPDRVLPDHLRAHPDAEPADDAAFGPRRRRRRPGSGESR